MLQRLLATGILALLLLGVPGVVFAQSSARVTGQISAPDRSLQAAGSRLTIQLQDVSALDKVAKVLADQVIDVSGKGGPFSFELSYNPAAIQSSGTYVVRAEIRNPAGQLLYTTTTLNRVLTGGNGNSVNIALQRVALPGTAGGEPILLLVGLLLAGAAGIFVLRRNLVR